MAAKSSTAPSSLWSTVRLSPAQAAYRRLAALPFHSEGHQLSEQHPFRLSEVRQGVPAFHPDPYVRLGACLDELKAGESFHVGHLLQIYEITGVCARCGLLDWLVAADGIRPLAPCPFSQGEIETRIRIPVPSGKLAVGSRIIPDGAPEIETLGGLPFFRAHHTTQFWAQYGFAQLDVQEVTFHSLLRGEEGALLLSDGPPTDDAPRITKIRPLGPAFACGDAARFFPEQQRLRETGKIHRGATLTSIIVPPGMYEVVLSHAPYPFPSEKAPQRRIAVRISRVGEVGPDPFPSDPHVAARAHLERFPWLGRAGFDAQLEAEASRFESV